MKRRLVMLIWAAVAMAAAAQTSPTSAPAPTKVDQPAQQLMRRYRIPGLAVGLIVNGIGHVYTYGLASLQTRQPVNAFTLFELGSVSKVFTATLAASAQTRGLISFSDPDAGATPLCTVGKIGAEGREIP